MTPADFTPASHPAADDDPATAAAKAKEASRLMALKMVVITLGVILVALLVVVFATLAIRAFRGSKPDAAALAPPPALPGEARPARPPVQAALPPGYRLVSTTLGDGRLAVTADGPDGALVILFDNRTMAEIGRIRVSQDK
ncbi:hypothetical protein ABEG18_19310 [Alsobacter sp. KACC 23698]|uniref:Fimbrial protein n=1 Tax=Alsobacter sp. KACC 23698 TaxID=3149229 RepID=A0AAU7JCG7_9HYPH